MFVLSVCPLVTTVHCAKTADSIVMPFLAVGQMGSSISVLDGGPDPFMHDGAIFFVGGMGWRSVTYGRRGPLSNLIRIFGVVTFQINVDMCVCVCRKPGVL